MPQAYTTANLLTSIKRKAMIPSSQSTFDDPDLLEIATEELQVGMIPLLMRVREEFYVTQEDQTIVAEQEAYPIPTRAIGGALRDVLYSSSNPITLRGDLLSLPRLEPDRIYRQRNSSFGGKDYLFSLRDNNIILVPAPSSTSGTLRVVYHRRPADLVQTSAAAQVTELTSPTVVTCSSVPTTFTTGLTYDLVKGDPGFDFRQVDKSISAVDIVAKTITFSTAFSTDLVVGDWISIAGTSPVPQVPLELQSVLAQRTVVQVLESLGDQQGKASAENKLKQIEESVLDLISPRVRGEARKVSAPNYYKGNAWGG